MEAWGGMWKPSPVGIQFQVHLNSGGWEEEGQMEHLGEERCERGLFVRETNAQVVGDGSEESPSPCRD